ncbi:MAG TPA: hypothetical protein VNI60_11850 [Pyrinomonadaceae bacterium]|nr:hypothetical protein [Pyrinomonadaceae bacterium]
MTFNIYWGETNAEKIKQTAFEVLLQKTDSKDKKVPPFCYPKTAELFCDTLPKMK